MSHDRWTMSVPLLIPSLGLDAEAWRDSDHRWLTAVLAEIEREAVEINGRSTAPNTKDLGDGRVETTIELLRTGSFVHRSQGRFTVDGRVLDELVANFAADLHMGAHPHHVFITIGHPKEGLDGPEAAGWIVDTWRAGDSVFGRIQLNAETVQKLREKKLKYFSPDFHLRNWTDETGKIVGAKLHSGAITNFPFIRGMAPFQLSAALGDAGVDEMTLTPEQVKQMVADQVTAMGDQLRKDLAKDVGSAVKAQLSDVTKDLKEAFKLTANAASSSGGPDLKTLADSVSRLDGSLQKALDENKRLSDTLNLQTEALEERDITELIRTHGLGKGKMTAGEVPDFGTQKWNARKWLADDGRFATVANLRAHLAKAPVVVKLANDAGSGGTPETEKVERLTLSDSEAVRLGFKDAAEYERCAEAHDAQPA